MGNDYNEMWWLDGPPHLMPVPFLIGHDIKNLRCFDMRTRGSLPFWPIGCCLGRCRNRGDRAVSPHGSHEDSIHGPLSGHRRQRSSVL